MVRGGLASSDRLDEPTWWSQFTWDGLFARKKRCHVWVRSEHIQNIYLFRVVQTVFLAVPGVVWDLLGSL